MRVSTALVLALVMVAPARPARADAVDLEKVKATLEREIRRRMDRGAIPSVSIALVRGEEVVWKAAFGFSNVWAKTPATPETCYSTGSTWKSATATALMQLVEQGKVSLDDPVNPLLVSYAVKQPAGAKPITFRHLLTHTSGLPTSGFTVPVWERTLPPSLEDATARLEATQPPETSVVYSNVAFALVGRLVSMLSATPYEVYLRQHVLEPLEMRSTEFAPSAGTVERLAIPYTRTPSGVAPLRQVRFDVLPAGDVYSTPEDMAHLLIAHLNGGVYRGKRVLSAASAEEMHRRQFFRDQGTTGFGLGFLIEEEGGRRLIGHDGLVPGLTAQMLGDPDAKVGVYLMSNLGEATRDLAAIAHLAVRLLRGETFTPFDPAIARRDPVPAGWAAYEGTYLSPRAGLVRVAIEDKALTMTVQGVKGWLVQSAPDGFFELRGDDWPQVFPVAFVRDASGAVTGLKGPSGDVAPRTKTDAATTMDLSLAPEGDPTGEWEGVASLGALRLEFVLRVRRDESGLSGDLDVPAQGIQKGALDHVLHHGKKVHFEYGGASARALVDGTLEGDAVRGTVKQGPFTLPVEAFRKGSEAAKAAKAAREAAAKAAAGPVPAGPPSPFAGRWEGAIEVQGQKLGIAVDVASDTAATLDIPVQGLSRAPLEDVKRDGTKVTFAFASPIGRAVFSGAIDGDAIRGTMTQNGATLPFELKRK